MPETGKITISSNKLLTWLSIGALVASQIVTYALLKDQVRRNTAQLEEHNLEVLQLKLQNIEEKVDKIDFKLDEFTSLAQEYFLKNNE